MTMESDPLKKEVTKNADKLIRNHMAWSMGAGLIPVPIADFFAVSAIQLDMIRQLCKLYEVDFRENDGKAIISALTGSGLARLGAQAVKFIPGVGSVIGGLTMSVLSGASSYAVGEIFKKHFEKGGTILDFDTDRLKKMYNDLFEKGKKVASEMKDQKEEEIVETSKDSSSSDAPTHSGEDLIVRKLNELSDLKDRGLIDDAEFAILKKKLIEKYSD